ncbi:MAG: VWA domain-containing protein [Reyranella sp.]|nr:VWA domain-containing protein [Reyranella sp.]
MERLCLIALHCAAVVLALSLGGGGVAAQPADGARMFLVLDASGSMWGRIGEQTKMQIARETVRSIVKDWRAQDRLGLISYGHRRKNDCTDIEVLKPVGPVDAAQLMAEVGNISPKGMTPMTAAVRLAAEQLKAGEGPAGVILVSDGIETCRADPCAVAAALKQADARLVVHTVGFDIQNRQAARQLECMAAATGGLALSAADSGDLLKAIAQAVAASRRAAPPPQPAAAPKEEPRPAWNLEGSARLVAGDDPLAGKDAVAWDFFRPAAAGADPGHAATSYKDTIEAELAPGDYLVRVSAGAVRLDTQVRIEPGRMNRLDVVLNAGRLGLRARRTADENQTGDVFWQVVSKADGAEIFTSFASETSTIVPAGAYTVILSLGAARVSREVEVAAGDTTAVSLVAGVGRLQAAVVLAPGVAVAGEPFVEIFAGTEPVAGEPSVANTYGNAPAFDLAGGAYRAHVQFGGVTRTFPVEIVAGRTLAAEFALDAGLAAFDAPGAEAIVVRAAGQADVATLYPPFAAYPLAAGRYVAVAEKSGAKKETTFDVVAGRSSVVRVAVP